MADPIRIPVEGSDAALCGVASEEGEEIWIALEPCDPFVPGEYSTDFCIASGDKARKIACLKALRAACDACIDLIAGVS